MHGWAIWQKYHVMIVLEISQFNDFILILCHVGFTIVSEQCSQNNFPIIKTNPFKVTKYKKLWLIFRPMWAKIKIFVIILFVIKNKKKVTHYKYTYDSNKTNSALFSGTIFIFSRRSIQVIESTNIKIKHFIEWFLLKQLYNFLCQEWWVIFFSVFCCFSIHNFVDSVIVFNIYTIIYSLSLVLNLN